MTVFQEMVVESILPNQIKWSWHHSFQKTMFHLMKSKYAIFSNIKVLKIEHSAFSGTPGIVHQNDNGKERFIFNSLVLQFTRFLARMSSGLISRAISNVLMDFFLRAARVFLLAFSRFLWGGGGVVPDPLSTEKMNKIMIIIIKFW